MKSAIATLVLLLLAPSSLHSQDKPNVAPTEFFTVTGAVEKEILIRIADLEKMPSIALEDVVITNHLGEPRGTAKGLKGIKMKDVLASMVILAESPKVLSEFYLTFIASDGYTVVYSWNELFNSPNGDHCYLVTEKDGVNLPDMPDRLLVITSSDFKTGRRHVKGLQKIIVMRAAKK